MGRGRARSPGTGVGEGHTNGCLAARERGGRLSDNRSGTPSSVTTISILHHLLISASACPTDDGDCGVTVRIEAVFFHLLSAKLLGILLLLATPPEEEQREKKDGNSEDGDYDGDGNLSATGDAPRA